MNGNETMDAYDLLERQLSGALASLESILQEKLDNFGIYYRLFSRVKSGASIKKKLNTERYRNDPEREIGDLFGLRITVYYQDDIEVCKEILEEFLTNAKWKKSESDTDTFSATKNNGIFYLPGFVKDIVLPYISDLRIKPTFEIQLRTVFFEGWHEAEHDMRYKESSIWDDMPKESRRLNSILATLEMCDQYMVTLFDDVGHDFYKSSNWGQMIRYRYRLKSLNGDVSEELKEVLSPELGKRIFKYDKTKLVRKALEVGVMQLDADAIVYIVNEMLLGTSDYNEEIPTIYWNIQHKNSGKRVFKRERNVVTLKKESAFDVNIDFGQSENKKEQFEKTLSLIYHNWLKKELGDIFGEEFKEEIGPIFIQSQGVICSLTYDENTYDISAILSHPAVDAVGKVWTVTLQVGPKDDHFYLHCKNSFETPDNAAKEIRPYNRPRIYFDLAKNLSVTDVCKLSDELLQVTESNREQFESLLLSKERKLPLLLITVESEPERSNRESYYARFIDLKHYAKDAGQNNLMKKIGYVCHVYYAYAEDVKWLSDKLSEDYESYRNSVRFFGANFDFDHVVRPREYKSYSEVEMANMPKDVYALRSRAPYYYQSVSGPDAVRHEIIEKVHHYILNHMKKN